MKIRAIALNTFISLLRNKIIILFCAVFVGVVLLMMTPLLAMKAMTSVETANQIQTAVIGIVAAIMSMVSGFGSLLAAFAAADAVWSEMKSGTILAVLARPVRRWEFLLGKYLGVQILMCIYVVCIFGLSYLLSWMGGARIHSSPWVLLVYPLVRYAMYSAIAMLLVMAMHPVVAFAVVLVISVLAQIVPPWTKGMQFLPMWLRKAFYAVLPSTNLLSESRFLTITQAQLKNVAWTSHLTALAYGLDYALVFFLLTVWVFHSRSLIRD